jgi:hypothetical protein
MNRTLLCSLTMAATLALTMSLPAKGWAASACCDESGKDCKSGQNVGDKGTCSIAGQVCVEFASECPDKKKHPGVLCDCGKPDSSLSVNPPFGLTFDKTFRNSHFEVSNGGNVPLHIDLMESGDTGKFAVKTPRKCKKKKHAASELEEVDEYSLMKAKATVNPKGCISFPVNFKAHKRGIYSDQLDIQSDAIETPNEIFYEFLGTIGKP